MYIVRIFVRYTIAIAMAANLIACAMPQYNYRPYALTKEPAMPIEQARAVCSARADAEATYARASVENRQRQEQNRVTGYSCQTTTESEYYRGANSRAMTNCSAQTNQYSSSMSVIGDGIAANNAYKKTGEIVFRGCMAEAGWGFVRECVANCR